MTNIETHIETFKAAIRTVIDRITNQQAKEISRFERELADLGYQDGPDWRQLDRWKSVRPPTMSNIDAGDKWGFCLYKSDGRNIVAWSYVGAVDAQGVVYKIKGNKPRLKRDHIEYPIKAFSSVCNIADADAVETLVGTALVTADHRTVSFKPHHPNSPIVDRPAWLVVGTVVRIDGKEWTIDYIKDGNRTGTFNRWEGQYVGLHIQVSERMSSGESVSIQDLMKKVSVGSVEVVKIGGVA